MASVYIESLEIDDSTLDKIERKHSVRFEEAEDVCFSEDHQVRKGTSGLYKVFGQSTAGRYLLVVLIDKSEGDWKIVTAREMTETEIRLYKKAAR